MRTTPRATPPTASTPRATGAVPLATPAISATASSTPAPTRLPAQTTAIPALTPSVVIQPQAPPTQTSQDRWRAQQIDRQPFEPPRQYITQQGAQLLWLDPRTDQALEIGTLLGEFSATAQFTLRGGGQPALEVPYTINKDYGLTAISDALIQRMREAGYTERVEAYVVLSEAVKAK